MASGGSLNCFAFRVKEVKSAERQLARAVETCPLLLACEFGMINLEVHDKNGKSRERRESTLSRSTTVELSKLEKRKRNFLSAAFEVFLEQGYEAANISEIVQRAGGSNATLYSLFGDKKGLLLAVLKERIEALKASMEVELSAHSPVREGLRRIGKDFVARVTHPHSLEFRRLLITVSIQHPEVSAQYLEQGPDRVVKALATYLEDRKTAGEIDFPDPEIAASDFLELASSHLVNRALFNPLFRPDEKMVSTSVDHAIDVFLHGASGHDK